MMVKTIRRCIDCGRDISDRGNRAIRCNPCQIEERKKQKQVFAKKHYDKEIVKELKRNYMAKYMREYRRINTPLKKKSRLGEVNLSRMYYSDDPFDIVDWCTKLFIEKNKIRPRAYADIIGDIKKIRYEFKKHKSIESVVEFACLIIITRGENALPDGLKKFLSV